MKYLNSEAEQLISKLVDVSHKKFDHHGFSAGFLGSMLERTIANLPQELQKEFIDDLKAGIMRFA